MPDTVSIVMLSATVPNYEEFANWVGRVKQRKIYVQYTLKRPVPIEHHTILEGKMHMIKDNQTPMNLNKLKEVTKKRNILKGKEDAYRKDPEKAERIYREEEQRRDDERDKKKIDFKEKAIQAKEKSIKKATAKATKVANEGGGKGPNSKKTMESTFQKTIESLTKLKMLPVIVFAFSRSGVVQLAEGLHDGIEFTDGYTKGLIKKFIKQKLQRLDEEDRDLPQIKTVCQLLVRGIGVHHAGLL